MNVTCKIRSHTYSVLARGPATWTAVQLPGGGEVQTEAV
jgi:hypothetical protein